MNIRHLLIHSLMALSLLTLLVGTAQAENTVVGTGAGDNLTTGTENTLLGVNAGALISTGNDNTLVGNQAGEKTTASFNTMVGDNAGAGTTTGGNNTFFGDAAGFDNTTGSFNTYLGRSAGANNLTGSGNVFLGRAAGAQETGSNKLYIHNFNNAAPLIYGEFDNFLVGINGDLGVGTQMPLDKLHVRDGNARIEQTADNAILNFVAGSNTWQITHNSTTGRLVFFSPDGGAQTSPFKFARQATENLFRVGVLAASTVDINGDLVVTGNINNPDYVFTPEYSLESIEAHAAYMWQHRHLPAVGAGQVNAQGQGMVNVGVRSQGMLEELEKAHIYIEQLHGESANKGKQIAALTQEVTALKANNAELKGLKEEVTVLKALVHRLLSQNRGTSPGKEG